MGLGRPAVRPEDGIAGDGSSQERASRAGMRYEEVLRRIEQRGARGLSRERAAAAAAATLATLADCLSPDAARRLAAQLPTELERHLRTSGRARRATLEAFLDAVAAREQLSRSEAFDDVRAVFNALEGTVTAAELAHVRAQLPDELQTLFEPPAAARWSETHAARRDDS
jgi:uncharacterized protein (DUF2267 family)